MKNLTMNCFKNCNVFFRSTWNIICNIWFFIFREKSITCEYYYNDEERDTNLKITEFVTLSNSHFLNHLKTLRIDKNANNISVTFKINYK